MNHGRDAPRYEVTLLTPEDLFFCSVIHAGLFELERQGVIRLRFRLNLDFFQPGVFVSGYRVRDLATGRQAGFAADMKDAPDGFVAAGYRDFDRLFKRNFQAAAVAREVPAEYRGRVLPAGLAYQVRSPHDHHRWLLYGAAGLHTLKHIRRAGIADLRRDLLAPIGHALYWKMRRHWRTPPIAFYERPAAATEPVVYYQTRVFDPDPRFANHLEAVVASKRAVNRSRAALVQALRAGLGAAFQGGIAADGYALAQHGAAVSPLPTAQADHLARMDRARVVVYTNGLLGSPAFKLAEYLAAGKCIVAERLACELPAPLRDGEHLLWFDTPEECLAHCRALLADPERCRRLGAAAQVYYREHVAPERTALRMIETALGADGAGHPGQAGARR
jgi:hypothetical protein